MTLRKLLFAGLFLSGSMVAWSGCTAPEDDPDIDIVPGEVDTETDLDTEPGLDTDPEPSLDLDAEAEVGIDDLPDSGTTY